MTEKKTRSREGWTRVRFGDVVRLATERCADPLAAGIERYVGLEHLEPSDLRIRTWGNVADGVTFTNRFHAGQVLFGKRRAYQRKVAVADFDGVCSGDIYVFEPADDRLLPELLPFICQTEGFFEHALKTSAGSLSPRTNWKSLQEYEFDLPPVEEQRRCSRALECAISAEESYVTFDKAVIQLRESCCDWLCSQSNETKMVRIDRLCSMQNGKAFPGNEYCDNGVRLLRPGNLAGDGTLTWHSTKTTRLPFAWKDNANSYMVRPGDVLINLTAQSLEDGFMGRSCLASVGDECLLNQRIGRFVVDRSLVLPAFLFRCLNTSRFKAHAIANCEGSKVKHLFWSHLAKFEIPLPSIGTQSEIIDELAAVDRTCRSVAARRLAATTLWREVLAQVA